MSRTVGYTDGPTPTQPRFFTNDEGVEMVHLFGDILMTKEDYLKKQQGIKSKQKEPTFLEKLEESLRSIGLSIKEFIAEFDADKTRILEPGKKGRMLEIIDKSISLDKLKALVLQDSFVINGKEQKNPLSEKDRRRILAAIKTLEIRALSETSQLTTQIKTAQHMNENEAGAVSLYEKIKISSCRSKIRKAGKERDRSIRRIGRRLDGFSIDQVAEFLVAECKLVDSAAEHPKLQKGKTLSEKERFDLLMELNEGQQALSFVYDNVEQSENES